MVNRKLKKERAKIKQKYEMCKIILHWYLIKPTRQTGGQKIQIMVAHWSEELTHKKKESDLYLK